MSDVVDIEGLAVSKDGRTICAVERLAISTGERLSIVGPNGSGKTTLLRVLAGLETDHSGRCRIEVPANERVYVHQSPWLFRGTVSTNVAYGLKAHGLAHREATKRVGEWLERLGLTEMADANVLHLSGGERRRVALARAMALRPRLLLLDEPFSDLDEPGRSAAMTALDELTKTTVVIASPVVAPTGDRGRVVELTTPPQLILDS